MILQITITKWHRKFIVINSHNEGLEVWECNIILIKNRIKYQINCVLFSVFSNRLFSLIWNKFFNVLRNRLFSDTGIDFSGTFIRPHHEYLTCFRLYQASQRYMHRPLWGVIIHSMSVIFILHLEIINYVRPSLKRNADLAWAHGVAKASLSISSPPLPLSLFFLN